MNMELLVEMYKSSVTLGQRVLQTLFLLNGAALLALLSAIEKNQISSIMGGCLLNPPGFFSIGLIAAAASGIILYYSHRDKFEAVLKQRISLPRSDGEEAVLAAFIDNELKRSAKWEVLSIGLQVLSILLFSIGCITALSRLAAS